MPKDITHWILAEKIFEQIEDGGLKDIIKEYKNLYYIGAVSFDIPFYALGKRGKYLSEAADRLHDGRAKEALLSIASGFTGEIPVYAIAFMFGMITHIAADSTFHPLVYYYTGNYFDKNREKKDAAVRKHREFETNLDLYYKRESILDNSFLMHRSYLNKNIGRNEFLELLRLQYFNGEKGNEKVICKALRTYIMLQYSFDKRAANCLLSMANKILKGKLSKIFALYYPKESSVDFEFYNKKIDYRHPVTGEILSESIGEIEERAVKKAVEIFNKLSGLNSKEEFVETLREIELPSLETGLIGEEQEMRYFR